MLTSNDQSLSITLDELQACLDAQLAMDEPDLAQLESLDMQVHGLVTATMAEPALQGVLADRLTTLMQSYARLIELVEGVRERSAEALRDASKTGRAARAYQSQARGSSGLT